jgi:hypothetical protein
MEQQIQMKEKNLLSSLKDLGKMLPTPCTKKMFVKEKKKNQKKQKQKNTKTKIHLCKVIPVDLIPQSQLTKIVCSNPIEIPSLKEDQGEIPTTSDREGRTREREEGGLENRSCMEHAPMINFSG